MRAAFFGYLLAFLVLLFLSYCVWMVIRACWTVISETLTNRELDKLAAEYTERRKLNREKDLERLNNGCDHVYGDPLGAVPDDVCVKCGLAKVRPAGKCDHVWRVLPGAIPQSQCENCGEKHGSVSEVE